MDFAAFDAQVIRISDLIIKDPFSPNIIVGVARGGWLPARLFSKYLKVKKLFSCGMAYADAGRTTMLVYQDIILTSDIRSILVVEDFLESGKSIKKAVDLLTHDGIDVRTGALGYLEKTTIIPTYSLGLVSEIPKMPWD